MSSKKNFEKMTDKEMLREVVNGVLTYFEENDKLQDFISKHEVEPLTGENKGFYNIHVENTDEAYRNLIEILNEANIRANGGGEKKND